MTVSVTAVRECLSNQPRLRILLMLMRDGPKTAKQMIAEGIDVPQTTLYRQLGVMESQGLLEVVRESRVRSVTEKTYDLSGSMRGFDLSSVTPEETAECCRILCSFTLGVIEEFDRLNDTGTALAGGDIYATDEELKTIREEMAKVMAPYAERRSPEQSRRTLSALITTRPDAGGVE